MAQNGTVILDNNATAKSIMAKGSALSNNANVVYDPNLGYFSLGSTGATSTLWSIDSWQEVAQ